MHRDIDVATRELAQAKLALRAIPAMVLATELDPHRERARPHQVRRGLQLVLRLLAFNAEAWLAERFNAYLSDPNEYRAILATCSRSAATSTTPRQITVDLDRPDCPRVARALELLAQELNATPASLPGDRRLTYQAAGTWILPAAVAPAVGGRLSRHRWPPSGVCRRPAGRR